MKTAKTLAPGIAAAAMVAALALTGATTARAAEELPRAATETAAPAEARDKAAAPSLPGPASRDKAPAAAQPALIAPAKRTEPGGSSSSPGAGRSDPSVRLRASHRVDIIAPGEHVESVIDRMRANRATTTTAPPTIDAKPQQNAPPGARPAELRRPERGSGGGARDRGGGARAGPGGSERSQLHDDGPGGESHHR